MTTPSIERTPAGLSADLLAQILPTRPTLIGEFSPAYETYKTATIADLSPQGYYEYVLALQLVDLNWAILQRRASSHVELTAGAADAVRARLTQVMEDEAEREYARLLNIYQAAGGEEEDFEDPIDWEGIAPEVENIVSALTSEDTVTRSEALTRVKTAGVNLEEVLSQTYLTNRRYQRHSDAIPDLERRARQLAGEYREVQRARPIDVSPIIEAEG